MPTFEQTFPGFIDACARLHTALLPVGMLIIIASFIVFFWHRPTQPVEVVKFLVKLFIISLLIANSRQLINLAQEAIDAFVTENIPARPEHIAELYAQKLADAQNASNQQGQSFLSRMIGAGLFESLVYAALTLISWLAMALLYYIEIFQKVCLFVAWSLGPVLFACFSIPALSGLASRHLQRLLGILMWKLGIALAATITEGLVALQTDQSFLVSGGVSGTLGYGLQNLLAVALIGLWVLFSTVAAPLYISRLLTHASGPAGSLAYAGEVVANSGLPLLVALWQRRDGGGDRPPVSFSDPAHPPSLIEPEQPVPEAVAPPADNLSFEPPSQEKP